MRNTAEGWTPLQPGRAGDGQTTDKHPGTDSAAFSFSCRVSQPRLPPDSPRSVADCCRCIRTQVPDFVNARIGGLPAPDVIRDMKWFREEFTPKVRRDRQWCGVWWSGVGAVCCMG